MARIVREDVYFTEPGMENTDSVVEAVLARVEATGVKAVVVASNRGFTALKLGERLRGGAKLVSVSEYKYDASTRRRLEELGAILIEECPLPVHDRTELRETLYFFGQGLKVAVEVAAIAAGRNAVERYEDIIAVGGTGRGADAAIVARATPIEDFYSPDVKKRMEIREVIAMPLKK
ncbi:MAG: pyruvate kinase alpha/beta domain-containing protein [Candidatus Bathyarchaeia archaeon]